MRIGISGHQSRPEIDWGWVREQFALQLHPVREGLVAVSSLAEGADQVFAEEALKVGGSIEAVIPFSDYERVFEPSALPNYLALRNQSDCLTLPGGEDEESAFFAAGQYIVDHCDRLIALWDGKPAVGLGGTADVVRYAIGRNVSVTHINPILRTVSFI